MTADPFVRSRESGPHARLAGRWRGRARTWFEPGTLADESPLDAEACTQLGGRFLVLAYAGAIDGRPFEGRLVLGHDLAAGKYVGGWIDSFHCGTTIMELRQDRPPGADGFSLLGSYAAGDGPRWGWRIEVRLLAPDHLVIAHWNRTPAGAEALGVEMAFRRT